MSDALSERPAIDRQRVEASMRPAFWHGYEQFRIVWCVLIAFCLFGVGLLTLGERPDAHWYWGAPALMFGPGLLTLLGAARLGYTLHQRHLRHERLDLRGQRRAVERCRSERIHWETRKSRRISRWVVVAIWSDPVGREHEAVAGPFDYDPTPLLDPKHLAVLADIFDPAISRIVPEGLPPLRHTGLSKEQRALAKPAVPAAVVTMVVVVIVIGFLIGIACLAYPLLSGIPLAPLGPPR